MLSLEGTEWFQVLNGVRQYTHELQHLFCRVTQLLLRVVGIHVHWMADFWSALLTVFLAGSTGFNLTLMGCSHHIGE